MPQTGLNGNENRRRKIGILEVQGAFQEHKVALMKAKKCLHTTPELEVMEVRHPDHLVSDMDGLIIPGGESTTISLFLKRNNMEEPLRNWIQTKGHVVWGTCAGMILLSRFTENQKDGGQPTLGMLDTVVSRNFFGRQVHSFEAQVTVRSPSLAGNSKMGTSDSNCHGVFIRAPAVLKTTSSDVQVLAVLERPEQKDVIVAVQQGDVMATAFHPELTDDLRWHSYFLTMIEKVKEQR
ncbi:pyridoxal 5'-phosphate synthase subunit PdxT-like [Ylistrum balloti]|uniref:pyridoxal 5'-phosphate synthase subunit PdxT-like n=1 Tax=Ylistrum balloti TaxID=509963 RepID=UPI002905AE96|nr:pyridoxal 5'-phosphate synthase subunit PdxT-like [Ylistrum balloti]